MWRGLQGAGGSDGRAVRRAASQGVPSGLALRVRVVTESVDMGLKVPLEL